MDKLLRLYKFSRIRYDEITNNYRINRVPTGDSIKFDVAYPTVSLQGETLRVLLSIDGGSTFSSVLFNKGGTALKSTSATTDDFTPNSSQWKTFATALPANVAGNNCVLPLY